MHRRALLTPLSRGTLLAHVLFGTTRNPSSFSAELLCSWVASANIGAWGCSSPDADFPLALAELQEIPGSTFLQLVKVLWMTA